MYGPDYWPRRVDGPYDVRTRRRFTRTMLALVAVQLCIGLAEVWRGPRWFGLVVLAFAAGNLALWRLHVRRYPLCARCGQVTHRDPLVRLATHECGPENGPHAPQDSL